MRIGKLNKSFVHAIYKLGKDSFSKYPWFSKKFLNNVFDLKGYYFGAFEDGKLVGCLLAVKEEMPKIWIYYLAVKKELRRAGIASLLIRKLFKIRSKERYLIFVDTLEGYKKAINFYKKHGFVIAAKVKHFYGKNMNGVILRRMFSKK